MNPDEALDLLESILRQYLEGTRPSPGFVVVRVPEGVLLLARGGAHTLICANIATLEVAT